MSTIHTVDVCVSLCLCWCVRVYVCNCRSSACLVIDFSLLIWKSKYKSRKWGLIKRVKNHFIDCHLFILFKNNVPFLYLLLLIKSGEWGVFIFRCCRGSACVWLLMCDGVVETTSGWGRGGEGREGEESWVTAAASLHCAGGIGRGVGRGLYRGTRVDRLIHVCTCPAQVSAVALGGQRRSWQRAGGPATLPDLAPLGGLYSVTPWLLPCGGNQNGVAFSFKRGVGL